MTNEQKNNLLPEGTYLATIIGGAIHTDDKGTQIGVQFQLKGRSERIWYYGSLGGQYSEYTFKNLARIGLNDAKVMDTLGGENSRFDSSFFVDPKKEVELVVEHWTNKNNVTRAQIKYINEPGGGKFGKVNPESVKKELAALNFRAEMAAARKSLGMAPLQMDEIDAENDAPSFNSDEQIPF